MALSASEQNKLDIKLRDALYAWDEISVKALLDQGANPNIHFRTSLNWSDKKEAFKRIENADPHGSLVVGALSYWIHRYFYDEGSANGIFDALLAAGADPNDSQEDNGYCMFNPCEVVMYAFGHQGWDNEVLSAHKTKILDTLLSHGANPCYATDDGDNVLHVSMWNLKAERLAWLGSMPNFSAYFKRMMVTRNNAGLTPIGAFTGVLALAFNHQNLYDSLKPFALHGFNFDSPVTELDDLTVREKLIEQGFADVMRRITSLQSHMRTKGELCAPAKPRRI